MIRKLKPSGARPRRKHSKKRPPYRSLSHGPTPEDRLAKLLKEAEERGVKPLAVGDLDAMGDVWPEDESIDDFLKWRRESRRRERK